MSIEQLTDRAFHHGPAHEANQLIHDVRERVLAEHGRALSYEVPLMGRPFSHLQQEVAPRLALFLHGKRMPWQASFVSLFVGPTLHFVWVEDFFEVIRESLGLVKEAFVAVLRRWQETGRAAAGLPPG